MTQEAVQITTTPPLPGLQLVQEANKALETIATDFAGNTDPAALAWPYSTWADTGTGTCKRRNAANSAWVIEGRLLRAHLPMYAQADVPALDIGPVYIIGKGPAEWVGAAYKPLISGIPGATFAEIAATTADQGPVMATDMNGFLYTWVETAYFSGYRSGWCGWWLPGPADTPDPWTILSIGGVLSEDDPAHARIISRYQEWGRTVDAASWLAGWNHIAALGGGDWKAADLRNVFQRMSGTDVDTANAMAPGEYQADALQNITGSSGSSASYYDGGNSAPDGAFALGARTTASGGGTNNVTRSGFTFDASRVVRTSSETRGAASRVLPVVLI